ncbi:MAG: prolyl oligopeptidase family serine peptidase, partial [Acidobacteria bacterium]|nr:prolyl oligopeptidase family serine peptidase [Acidobacteriota bacterium]
LALVGGSLGGHTALLYAAAEQRVRAVAVLCPVVHPQAFAFPPTLAAEFAGMLHGVSGTELLAQWQGLEDLTGHFGALAERPVLLVTGGRDELFPPSHYTAFAAALPGALWISHPEGDHAFSACRPWLVETVTDWLAARLDGPA